MTISPGDRRGKLTILSEDVARKRGWIRRWFCRCDCGNLTSVPTDRLNSGKTRSCGCLRIEALIVRNTTHNICGFPEYAVWASMKDRCYNPHNRSFSNYGGRGISVCAEWRNDFAAFVRDMGRRPLPDLTIERLDVNGSYCPSNCVWESRIVQNRNRRSSKLTSRDVREIRSMIGTMTNVELGKLYGVNNRMISAIKHNHSWVGV